MYNTYEPIIQQLLMHCTY